MAAGARSAANEVRQRPEGLRRLRAFARQDDRLAGVDPPHDLALARDEHVGRPAQDRHDVGLADADVRVRAVEHDAHAVEPDAHQPQRLEAELGVLQRRRVEHRRSCRSTAAASIVAMTSGREARRGVDDHEVEGRRQRRVEVLEELHRDRLRLVGPHRARAGRGGRSGARRGSRRPSRRRACRLTWRGRRSCARAGGPSASPASPNCRSRSTTTVRWPASASATPRLVDVTVLPMPPFGPRTHTRLPRPRSGARARAARQRLLHGEERLGPGRDGASMSTMSSAPEVRTSRTKPFGLPPQTTTSGCSSALARRGGDELRRPPRRRRRRRRARTSAGVA